MREIDRQAMGLRIREIRRVSGLRQWELARLLGTTQSAVHKYEHGIVPEPRRLLEIARIGETSVEWILTGTHGEGGTSDRERIAPEMLRTARLLRDLDGAQRARVEQALRTLHDAARAISDLPPDTAPPPGVASLVGTMPALTSVLSSAERIHRSIVERLLEELRERLQGEPIAPERRTEERG